MVTRQEVIGKLADIMYGWRADDFEALGAVQFCADMLEIFPGKAPILSDDEAEALDGMTDYEIHAEVKSQLAK